MRNLKTYELFQPGDTAPQIEVLGVFGPNDHEAIKATLAGEGTIHWDFLANTSYARRSWEHYVMKVDGAMIVLRDNSKAQQQSAPLNSRRIVGILFDRTGFRMAVDADGDVLWIPRKIRHVMLGMAGSLIEMGVLDMLPSWMPRSDKVKCIIDAAELPYEHKKVDVAAALIWTARKMISKGQTPTMLMSTIRRFFPGEYEAEFGPDDMPADMGDMGF